MSDTQITAAYNINVGARYSEADAATLLGISQATLARRRRGGQVGFVRLGRKVEYLGVHLVEHVRQQICPAIKTSDIKLENGGSDENRAVLPGTAAATNPRPSKLSALAYAQTILKKRSAG